jgi:hypothetical protein
MEPRSPSLVRAASGWPSRRGSVSGRTTSSPRRERSTAPTYAAHSPWSQLERRSHLWMLLGQPASRPEDGRGLGGASPVSRWRWPPSEGPMSSRSDRHRRLPWRGTPRRASALCGRPTPCTPSRREPAEASHSDDRALPTEHFTCESHALELADPLVSSNSRFPVRHQRSPATCAVMLIPIGCKLRVQRVRADCTLGQFRARRSARDLAGCYKAPQSRACSNRSAAHQVRLGVRSASGGWSNARCRGECAARRRPRACLAMVPVPWDLELRYRTHRGTLI